MNRTVLTSRIPAVRREIDLAVEKAVGQTAKGIEVAAKSRAPVNTGRLRDSIEMRPHADGWEVEAGIFYAHLVEFGTRNTAARPFFVPAIERGAHLLPARVRAAVRKAAK